MADIGALRAVRSVLAPGSRATRYSAQEGGLDADPGRSTPGKVVSFQNDQPYHTYRVLVTKTRGNAADAVQYGEVMLLPKNEQ